MMPSVSRLTRALSRQARCCYSRPAGKATHGPAGVGRGEQLHRCGRAAWLALLAGALAQSRVLVLALGVDAEGSADGGAGCR